MWDIELIDSSSTIYLPACFKIMSGKEGDNCGTTRRHLVVTGFGPFSTHSVNASWEAVKILDKYWKNEEVSLITEEIPVSYDFVLKNVPARWSDKAPVAVVHVGVSGSASKLTLEKLAKNCTYGRPDVQGCCPPNHACLSSGDDKLHTCFDVEKLRLKVNSNKHSKNDVEAIISTDAGQYLCEFVYYKSLESCAQRSLFIHVPMVDKPYSSEQVAQAICLVLEGLLEELNQ